MRRGTHGASPTDGASNPTLTKCKDQCGERSFEQPSCTHLRLKQRDTQGLHPHKVAFLCVLSILSENFDDHNHPSLLAALLFGEEIFQTLLLLQIPGKADTLEKKYPKSAGESQAQLRKKPVYRQNSF